jgi:phosphatidate cytidylyltransferase
MKNLAFRLLTATVAIPIILILLYFLPWWAFGGLAALAMNVASLEFFQLTHKGDRLGQAFGLSLNTVVYTVLVVTEFGTTNPSLALCTLVAVTPAALLFTLLFPAEQATSLARMTALVTAPFYLGTSLAAIACLRRIGSSTVGAGLVVMTLMVAWFSDTAGYFVGKGLGGPRLYPSVSPNKTWSGALGGLIGSGLAAVLAHVWYLHGHIPLEKGVLAAVIAGAFGQAGDLCESLMKRSAGVKDSSGILPGHGGILDRLDAVMFAALALYVAVRSGWLPLG